MKGGKARRKLRSAWLLEGILSLAFLLALILLGGCGGSSSKESRKPSILAEVADKGSHYEVILDYETGASPRDMGRAYAEALVRCVPDVESKLDAILHALVNSNSLMELSQGSIPSWLLRVIAMTRLEDILPQLQEPYLQELEGLADVLASSEAFQPGDGKLSRTEILAMNLGMDIGRWEQCCALSVFGSRSSTGAPQTVRVLEFPVEQALLMRQLHGVTKIKNGDKSLCLVQPLGLLGVVSGVSASGIFAAVLDSPTHQKYESQGRRSYSFDLRHALENCASVEAIAEYMGSPSRAYTYNHVIFMSDGTSAGALENNFSGVGPNMRRALRTSTSKLNEKILWNEPEAFAAVTAFVLEGNDSSFFWGHPEPERNSARWEVFRAFMAERPRAIASDDLMGLLGRYEGDSVPDTRKPGDIYTNGALHLLYLSHEDMTFKAAFLPPDDTPRVPSFETIDLSFLKRRR